VTAQEALKLHGTRDVAFVDLREANERKKHGEIPGSLHAPYPDLMENIQPGGVLHELATATSKQLLFYCAFGERSAMAVRATHAVGIAAASHLKGGIDAWKKAGGPTKR
jgi:rhodanese-related sulfurtransferase